MFMTVPAMALEASMPHEVNIPTRGTMSPCGGVMIASRWAARSLTRAR